MEDERVMHHDGFRATSPRLTDQSAGDIQGSHYPAYFARRIAHLKAVIIPLRGQSRRSKGKQRFDYLCQSRHD